MTISQRDAALAAARTAGALVQHRADKEAVRELGSAIGYGNMMTLAEECWREMFEDRGEPTGGEHTHGPSAANLVPCPCTETDESPGNCDWCCGNGRVAKRVAQAMRETQKTSGS